MRNTGIADIALVIDTSGSMTEVFDYLIGNLSTGIKRIVEGAKNFKEFDIRIGIVAGDKAKFFIIPFTNDAQSIINKLKIISEDRVRANEIMLYGLDLALCDLEWRPEAKRYMIMITDEELDSNFKPKRQKRIASSGKLQKRIESMGVLFHYIAPQKCSYYKQFEIIDKALWHPIEHAHELKDSQKIHEIFEVIVRSISKSVSLPVDQSNIEKFDEYICDYPKTEKVVL